jgi:hypothetical protein
MPIAKGYEERTSLFLEDIDGIEGCSEGLPVFANPKP